MLLSPACDILSALGGGRGLPCDDDTACPSGSICFGGHCTEPECRGDEQCPAGQACRQGRCSPASSDAAVNSDGASASDARFDVPALDSALLDGSPGGDADRAHFEDAAVASDGGAAPDVTALSDLARNDGLAADQVAAADASASDGRVASPPTLTITPADGTFGVAIYQQIALTFSEEMDRPSVEAHFVLTNALNLPVSGTWRWADSTAFFDPGGLIGGERHIALLGGGCRDAQSDSFAGSGGLDCVAPAQCSGFIVNDGAAPTVASVVPADNATNVALQPAIRVTFSEAMLQSSVVVGVTVNAAPVAGAWSWTSSTVFAFTPTYAFGCNQLAQVAVEEGARDASGMALTDSCTAVTGAAFCSSFTVKPTHEECDQCSDGCWDVSSGSHGCTCVAEMPRPGDPPPCGEPWCMGCNSCEGNYDCACPYHCHYTPMEKFEPCNCRQVCS